MEQQATAEAEALVRAREILDKFSGRTRSPEEALLVLDEVVNGAGLRTEGSPEATDLVARAEGLAGELLDVSADRELHMDDIAFIAAQVRSGDTLETALTAWRNRHS